MGLLAGSSWRNCELVMDVFMGSYCVVQWGDLWLEERAVQELVVSRSYRRQLELHATWEATNEGA